MLADVVQGDQIRRGAVELDFSAADPRIKCRTVLAPAADVVGPAGLALQAQSDLLFYPRPIRRRDYLDCAAADQFIDRIADQLREVGIRVPKNAALDDK